MLLEFLLFKISINSKTNPFSEYKSFIKKQKTKKKKKQSSDVYYNSKSFGIISPFAKELKKKEKEKSSFIEFLFFKISIMFKINLFFFFEYRIKFH